MLHRSVGFSHASYRVYVWLHMVDCKVMQLFYQVLRRFVFGSIICSVYGFIRSVSE